MRLRKLLFILAIAPSVGLAQDRVNLDFGSPGEREIWISDKLALPASTLKTSEAQLTLPKQGGASDRIYVWDRSTGNVASKAVANLGAPWKLKPEDYQLVGRVTLRIEHNGKPVSVAFVKLKDGNGEKDRQLDASQKGEAVFFGVKPGNISATVRYNSNGVDAEPAKQTFALDLKRTEPDPVFTIVLSQPVETVGEAATATDDKPGAATGAEGQSPRGSLIGNILVYLLGLGVALAAIWFGLKYMRENQDKVKDQLQKVGVQIPDPADAANDPAPAPVPVPPAPPEKILLDDADPSSPVQGTAVSAPSLVLENGDVFELAEGINTVGRDASNSLALVAESTVSRRHATLTRNGQEMVLRDEGSSNGTYVNGVRIDSEVSLKPGDQVQFGQVRMRFEV